MFLKKKIFCSCLALSLFANLAPTLPSHAFLGLGGIIGAVKTGIGIGKKILGIKDNVQAVANTVTGGKKNKKNKDKTISGSQGREVLIGDPSRDTLSSNAPFSQVQKTPRPSQSDINLNWPLPNNQLPNSLNPSLPPLDPNANLPTRSPQALGNLLGGQAGSALGRQVGSNPFTSNNPLTGQFHVDPRYNLGQLNGNNNFPSADNSTFEDYLNSTLPPNPALQQSLSRLGVNPFNPNGQLGLGQGSGLLSGLNPEEQSIANECLTKASSGQYNNRPCFAPGSAQELIAQRIFGKNYPTVLDSKGQLNNLSQYSSGTGGGASGGQNQQQCVAGAWGTNNCTLTPATATSLSPYSQGDYNALGNAISGIPGTPGFDDLNITYARLNGLPQAESRGRLGLGMLLPVLSSVTDILGSLGLPIPNIIGDVLNVGSSIFRGGSPFSALGSIGSLFGLGGNRYSNNTVGNPYSYNPQNNVAITNNVGDGNNLNNVAGDGGRINPNQIVIGSPTPPTPNPTTTIINGNNVRPDYYSGPIGATGRGNGDKPKNNNSTGNIGRR